MALPSSTYTEIVTTTINRYSSKLFDNVMDHHPLLARLRRKGRTVNVSGGVKILENLEYAENSTAKWYNGLELLDISASDVLTSAEFAWKQFNVNAVFSGLEELQNNGKEQMHNLIRARIRNAEKTAVNQIGAAVFNSNTENGGKAIGGLQHLVPDDPTTGVVGGIDSDPQTWWRSQRIDLSDQAGSTDIAKMPQAMNRLMIATTRDRDMPDMFLGGTTYFTFYLESLQANQRFTSDTEASAGFRSLKFWGGAADVFFDVGCLATRMYALNTDYIYFRSHTDRNFTTAANKVATNQDATVVPIFWAGNMTASNRSLQGVITA
jgi:hypothetical protein